MDWSLVGAIPKERDSSLGDLYQSKLDKVSRRYFLRDEGSVYLVTVDNCEEYYVAAGNQLPVDDGGKANQWERQAYATRRPTYSPTPVVDDNGTYLAAYTPIIHDRKVVGLVAAEYDSAPLSDFQGIVRRAFWLSIIPAVLASLVVAYILTLVFVEPMEVFRTIEETTKSQRVDFSKGAKDDLWDSLTVKEREVAEWTRQGLTNKEIAEQLFVTHETVKQHLKNIREKTGWSKVDLAVQAQGRRAASLSLVTA